MLIDLVTLLARIGVVLFFLFLFFGGHVWVLRVALSVSVRWFFICLLVPLGSLVFAITHAEGRKPLVNAVLMRVFGIFLAFVAINYVTSDEGSDAAHLLGLSKSPSVVADSPLEPVAPPNSSSAKPEEPPPAIAATKCAVTSSPSEADVLVDGTVVGKTPAEVTLWAGRKNVLAVRLEGYGNAEEVISPNLGQATARHFTLSPAVRVQVSSEPANAEVVEDENVLGRTPIELNLSEGRHSLLFRAPGRVAVSRLVEVQLGHPQTVEAVLPPAAYINVRSFPDQSKIFVDGAPTPYETPHEVTVSAHEEHVIEVRRRIHITAKQKIAPIEADDHEQMTLALEAYTLTALKERLANALAKLKQNERALVGLHAQLNKLQNAASAKAVAKRSAVDSKIAELERSTQALRREVDERRDDIDLHNETR